MTEKINKNKSTEKLKSHKFWLQYLFLVLIISFTSIIPYIIQKEYNIIPYSILVFLAVYWPFMTKPDMEVTENGWVVEDTEFFQFLTQNDPPRPFKYIDQIKIDIRHWKPLMMMGVGIGCIISGILQKQYYLLLFGFGVLIHFCYMLKGVVEDYKQSPILYANIERIDDYHPRFKNLLVSYVNFENGQKISISMPAEPAEYLFNKYGQIQAAFLFHKEAEYQTTIGLRPINSRT